MGGNPSPQGDQFVCNSQLLRPSEHRVMIGLMMEAPHPKCAQVKLLGANHTPHALKSTNWEPTPPQSTHKNVPTQPLGGMNPSPPIGGQPNPSWWWWAGIHSVTQWGTARTHPMGGATRPPGGSGFVFVYQLWPSEHLVMTGLLPVASQGFGGERYQPILWGGSPSPQEDQFCCLYMLFCSCLTATI